MVGSARIGVLASAVAIFAIFFGNQAMADYDIPDDCLGTWKHCKSYKLKHFTDYGPYFTDEGLFTGEVTTPDLDDPYRDRIQPLAPSPGTPTTGTGP
jgi:hypothetical protein